MLGGYLRSPLPAESWHVHVVETHNCRRESGDQIGKTETHIGYQIRKTACIFAENRKPNAKTRKNRKPQQTPTPKKRRFSVQKPKNLSFKWLKPQNRKSQRPPPCSIKSR